MKGAQRELSRSQDILIGAVGPYLLARPTTIMVRCDCTCEDDLHYRVHLANGAGEKLLQLMMHDTVFSAKAFIRAVSLLVFYDSGRDIAFKFCCSHRSIMLAHCSERSNVQQLYGHRWFLHAIPYLSPGALMNCCVLAAGAR